MKRLVLSVGVAFVGLLSLAGAASAATPDSANGWGNFALGPPSACSSAFLAVHAQSNNTGTPVLPGGWFYTKLNCSAIGLPPVKIQGAVTCLHAHNLFGGKATALIGGKVTSTTQPILVPLGSGIVIEVDDLGPAFTGLDRATETFTGGPPISTCPSPALTTAPVTGLGYTVVDTFPFG
jgi:hypothetical protein